MRSLQAHVDEFELGDIVRGKEIKEEILEFRMNETKMLKRIETSEQERLDKYYA